MPRKKSYPTMTDQFCGAGGSGQGASAALKKFGGEITQALNHWKLATETYSTNFQKTKVYCTDISACDPRNFDSTDGLCTSPECTTHTPAGGNTHRQLKKQMDLFEKQIIDPATERSRATMWDVCRFAEYHKYNFIIVENVVEAKTRWPLFDTWLQAMHVLGYKHKCCYRNSMHHHPTPQSRDRMYVVFWKAKNKAPKLDYMPEAYCYKCAAPTVGIQSWKNPEKKYGKYNQQYIYRSEGCSS
jgi:DNA (cytosine-5)-methyltransferase 1